MFIRYMNYINIAQTNSKVMADKGIPPIDNIQIPLIRRHYHVIIARRYIKQGALRLGESRACVY
jgi:hypothetical protein